jgi:esterase/lipase
MTEQKQHPEPFALRLTRRMFQILTPIMPGIMDRYAYNLWITPTRVHPPDREFPYMEQAEASYIIANGLKIRVWSWGKGPTVLFIHGWGGRGTQISCYIDDLLKAGFQVMSLDLPAHGQSDGKQTNAFDVTQAVTEVFKKIDNLHTVITHSFGGIIFGYFYNTQMPIKKIVMLCPPSTLHTAFNQFSNALHLPHSVQEHVIQKLKKNFGEDVFEKLSLVNNIQKASQPVLVVHDKQDEIVPYQEGEIVANAAKYGTFYLSHDLGHRKVLYDKSIVEKVVQFISS